MQHLLSDTASYCLQTLHHTGKIGKCLQNDREIRVAAQSGLYFGASHTIDLRKSVSPVARSRQVCIYWLWKRCLLLSFYLRGERVLRHGGTLSVGYLSRTI
jgi:hypothetical protein